MITKQDNKTIIVVHRLNGFMAYQKEHPGVWGAGKNAYEAIGNCINAHRKVFEIEIIDETK